MPSKSNVPMTARDGCTIEQCFKHSVTVEEQAKLRADRITTMLKNTDEPSVVVIQAKQSYMPNPRSGPGNGGAGQNSSPSTAVKSQ
ncbi:hypothetical protein BBO_03555 [Beauveria brongniartii RCEF 3172]|uniref:Uncharacterized protein n=1 Tax=Beauveria brongniartii RCEF 3172 TaxID=1081107 RepID=A0A167FYD0_9HYPO|nr:hypothetical protein BBO_03555 [Beauveria brongniartii RCEF 3172]